MAEGKNLYETVIVTAGELILQIPPIFFRRTMVK